MGTPSLNFPPSAPLRHNRPRVRRARTQPAQGAPCAASPRGLTRVQLVSAPPREPRPRLPARHPNIIPLTSPPPFPTRPRPRPAQPAPLRSWGTVPRPLRRAAARARWVRA